MLRRLWSQLRRFFGRTDEQGDPYARVRQPVRGGPPSRSSAVALDEP